MKEFTRALSALAVHFDKPLTNELIDSYVFALECYPEDDLVRVCKVLIRGKFFPRAHDFIQHLEGPKLNIDDRANGAWSALCAHAWEGRPCPDDEFIFPAMDGVCNIFMIKNADHAEAKSYGFQFRANYRMAVERAESAERRRIAAGPQQEQIEEGVCDELASALAEGLDMNKALSEKPEQELKGGQS